MSNTVLSTASGSLLSVIAAKAGTQALKSCELRTRQASRATCPVWVLAFAGMTAPQSAAAHAERSVLK
jgi:hypothetical protein